MDGIAGTLAAERPVGAPDHAAMALQRLSPTADAAPSPYLKVQFGRSSTLDIVFTKSHMPAGTFCMTDMVAESSNTIVHVNVTNNDYYQNGIPGITDSIQQTAAWLSAVRDCLGASCVRTAGLSMGAYAAVLFGDMIDADLIFSFSAVVKPGHLTLGQKTSFRDIAARLRTVVPRTVITFGAFELCEYRYLQHCLDAGVDLDEIVWMPNFHPGAGSLNFHALFRAPDVVPIEAVVKQRYDSPLDLGDVAALSAAFGSVYHGRHAEVVTMLGSILERDPGNPELYYRLGVHLVLSGDTGPALPAFRTARTIFEEVNAAAGRDILGPMQDLKRRSVKDYAHLLKYDQLRAVHAAIDEALL